MLSPGDIPKSSEARFSKSKQTQVKVGLQYTDDSHLSSRILVRAIPIRISPGFRKVPKKPPCLPDNLSKLTLPRPKIDTPVTAPTTPRPHHKISLDATGENNHGTTPKLLIPAFYIDFVGSIFQFDRLEILKCFVVQ
ncbi:TPA: hypothetical protein EYP70_00685 [Candidatus Bathyarchaeota archaeon]|nr:hypothetical protein [Candidatus Bathyarchaeota archaeon]